MTVTGEGCQPITDLGWKKKENKYLGNSSLSEREVKDLKDMGKRTSLEQFNYKFPDNEKHLGLENVSLEPFSSLLRKIAAAFFKLYLNTNLIGFLFAFY